MLLEVRDSHSHEEEVDNFTLEQLADLLTLMLRWRPEARYTAKALLDHAWFADPAQDGGLCQGP